MDAIDFGPSAENKMAVIELLKIYTVDFVNAISLESFHQSTFISFMMSYHLKDGRY